MKTLAIKYRPQTFDDVVEQGEIKTILQEQIFTGTHKNCYLFTGGAGTGKTTCARIFANELNGQQGNPIEIDAASNNGVESVRDIIDGAKFKSIDSKYKIYILDECHMLSNGAWNAMLKIIEEPPAQTIFIFCTTDPQKIPATILSRVQRYDFRRITFDSVVSRLAYICKAEAEEFCEVRGNDIYPDEPQPITYTTPALEYIAKIADGGMRDAITLLDKCASFNSEITVENVTTALGTVDYDTFIELTDIILSCKADKSILLIEDVYRRGLDLKQFMKQYQLFLLDLAKFCLLGDFKFLQMPDTYADKLKALNDFAFIKYLLKEIISLNNTLKWDTNPKALVESTLILLCQED